MTQDLLSDQFSKVSVLSGIVVDIDDTISDTTAHCVSVLSQKLPTFGMSQSELCMAYVSHAGVPWWDANLVSSLVHEMLTDAEFLLTIPSVPTAIEQVQRLQMRIPIACYLTSRLPFSWEVTSRWLQKNRFPLAPVIHRPPEVLDNYWKVSVLSQFLPETLGLVDDQLHFPSNSTYAGKLYSVSRFHLQENYSNQIRHFSCWKDFVESVLVRPDSPYFMSR